MSYFWAILLQIFLIGLNAIFACAEIAVISMNEAKLNLLSTKGEKQAKTAKKISKLIADPARFLSTIQVAITLAGFLGSAFAADVFAEPLVRLILSTGLPISAKVISPVCVIFITIILAFFNIVFGELVPKRIAMNNAEKVSIGLASILSVVSIIFKPIVALLSVSTNGILKLFGISPKDKGDEVTEADIIMMAEVGKESGNIQSEENQLIKNIFEFNDLTIGEICTHRKEVDILFTTQNEKEWRDIIKETMHTYYPVCGESADDIQGVLNAKTYFKIECPTKETLLSYMQQPLFLYENSPANKVFAKMQQSHEYFGIVLDEYGGMRGIITIHDLLEVIVGTMNEKGKEEEYTIQKVGDSSWEIIGVVPFNKMEDALGFSIHLAADNDYETFNGYVLSLLEEVPTDNLPREIETEQISIRIIEVEKQRIIKLGVTVKQRESE